MYPWKMSMQTLSIIKMTVIFDFTQTFVRLAVVFWVEIEIFMGILWNWNPFTSGNIDLVLYVQNDFMIL